MATLHWPNGKGVCLGDVRIFISLAESLIERASFQLGSQGFAITPGVNNLLNMPSYRFAPFDPRSIPYVH